MGTDAAGNLPPLPLPDEVTAPFWAACRRGQLVVQRCVDCGRRRFPPREMCPHCHSFASDWPAVSGRGRIYSRVVVHGPVLPSLAARVPYAVVLVELDEEAGLRMVGNVLGASPEALRIGAPVEVVFEVLTPEISLPQWRLSDR